MPNTTHDHERATTAALRLTAKLGPITASERALHLASKATTWEAGYRLALLASEVMRLRIPATVRLGDVSGLLERAE